MNKYEKAMIESNKHLTRENQLIFAELIERATPKKVIIDKYYKCSKCNEIVELNGVEESKTNFCPNCGQALEWE